MLTFLTLLTLATGPDGGTPPAPAKVFFHDEHGDEELTIPGMPVRPRSRGHVTFGSTKVDLPSIPVDQLERYIRSRTAAFQGCYETRTAPADRVKGSVKLTFDITLMGRTSTVGVVAADGGESELGLCFGQVVRSWILPFKPASVVKVEVLIRFEPAA